MKRTEVCSEARGTALFTILRLELNPRGAGGGMSWTWSKTTPHASGNCNINISSFQNLSECIYTSNWFPWQRMQMCMQRFAVFVQWCGVSFPLKSVNCQESGGVSSPTPRQDLCRNGSQSLTLKSHCTVCRNKMRGSMNSCSQVCLNVRLTSAHVFLSRVLWDYSINRRRTVFVR